MENLDFSRYVAAPKTGVAGGVALGVALISALPKGAPAPVRAAAQALHASTLALQTAWRKSSDGEPAPAPDAGRDADHALDVAWRATEQRLGATASLPAADFPDAARAAMLYQRLFPDGLGFLTLPWSSEWAESDKRLGLIKEDKLEADLDELAGKDFLAALRAAHAAYGKVLGITQAEDPPADVVQVQQPLHALQSAVRNYALQVVAAAGADPGFAEDARAALLPIDRVRAANARQAGSGSVSAEPAPPAQDVPAVGPTTPIPEVPAG